MTTNGFATPFKEGTIKHACYVALERAGAEGLTVRARDDGPGAILDAGGGCPWAFVLFYDTGLDSIRTCGALIFGGRRARERLERERLTD